MKTTTTTPVFNFTESDFTSHPTTSSSSIITSTSITNSDEEADKTLKNQICRLYGLSLDDYLNQFESSTNDNDNLIHGLNDSFQNNNDGNIDLSIHLPHNISSSFHHNHDQNLHHLEEGGSLGPFDSNLDLFTNQEGGDGNASMCFGSWDGILCWPETNVCFILNCWLKKCFYSVANC